jgi:preprotein translocase subunit SecA
MIEAACEMIVDTYKDEIDSGKVNPEALLNEIKVNLNIGEVEALKSKKIDSNKLLEELKEKTKANYEAKEKEIGNDIRELERVVLLKVVDGKWMDHIDNMDELKNGIGLRAYGQHNPVDMYRVEGGEMFDEMVSQIKLEVAKIMLHVVRAERNAQRVSNVNITNASLDNSAISGMNVEGESQAPNANQTEKQQPIVNDGPKVGRNDPCPCGSGKKYKNCCGRN